MVACFLLTQLLIADAPLPSATVLPPLAGEATLSHLWSFNESLQDAIGGWSGELQAVGDESPRTRLEAYGPGRYDQALLTPGGRYRLELPAQSKASFTVGGLVYVATLPATGERMVLVTQHYTFSVAIDSEGRIIAGMFDGRSSEDGWLDLVSEARLSAGSWAVIAAGFGDGEIRLLVATPGLEASPGFDQLTDAEGRPWQRTTQSLNMVADLPVFNQPWSLAGCCDRGVAKGFVGAIDEFAIWDRNLSHQGMERAMGPWIERLRVTPPPPVRPHFPLVTPESTPEVPAAPPEVVVVTEQGSVIERRRTPVRQVTDSGEELSYRVLSGGPHPSAVREDPTLLDANPPRPIYDVAVDFGASQSLRGIAYRTPGGQTPFWQLTLQPKQGNAQSGRLTLPNGEQQMVLVRFDSEDRVTSVLRYDSEQPDVLVFNLSARYNSRGQLDTLTIRERENDQLVEQAQQWFRYTARGDLATMVTLRPSGLDGERYVGSFQRWVYNEAGELQRMHHYLPRRSVHASSVYPFAPETYDLTQQVLFEYSDVALRRDTWQTHWSLLGLEWSWFEWFEPEA